MTIITNLLLSLVMTLIVEIPLIKTLLNKKNIIINALLINIITNIVLNLLSLNLYGLFGFTIYFSLVIFFETIIPYIEYLMYKFCYEDIDYITLEYIYLINLASFVLGGIVYKYLVI